MSSLDQTADGFAPMFSGRMKARGRQALGLALLLVAAAGCAEREGDAAAAPDGEEIYNRFCFSCHAAGIAGAPKTGDAEAWAPLVAKGPELLLRSVKEGISPGMPPMGLCNTCSDAEIAAAIEFMLPAPP